MQVNMLATVVLAAYFGVLVGLSAWSSRRGKKRTAKLAQLTYGSPYDEALSPGFVRLLLANRNVPLCLGLTSMTVTWIGGGFVSGTAEAVYVHGLLSTQVPIGYTISLIFGGLFFSHKMRATRSLTMLDPFQQQYGRWIGPLLCLPALAGELFWSASVYAALGQAAEVVAGLSGSMIIVLSSLIVALCTCLGGLPTVVRTDALHLFAAFVGLWVCVPFCMTTKFANNEVAAADASSDAALYSIPEMVDRFFSLVYGGIPWQVMLWARLIRNIGWQTWSKFNDAIPTSPPNHPLERSQRQRKTQVYFQRVLSSATVFDAQMLSYVSAVGCLMFAVPPILIGSTSRRANFTAAGYPGPARLRPQDQARVLPLAIRYLCPGLVSMMGMVAIVGAVMSSADSSALSASTLVDQKRLPVPLQADG
ncbi:high-affinity choline transporter 1-like [Rhipicephalus sanguineus]|uniref:high-affinity choline transporter 1-like n=1 Tax=Rhipicephalus sanguineus TaxID=34632 RepID=UPI0020C37331|nr:high-affinity choline transporter 1-like [Rhipicephalus sanguineus]